MVNGNVSTEWLSIIQIYLEFKHIAGFCTRKKTGEPGEKPSEQRDQQPPTRDRECGKRTGGYQRPGARASTVTRLLSEAHNLTHRYFGYILQCSQAVSCNAGLVINFVFLKYYLYLINWKS